MPNIEQEVSKRRTFAIISHPDAGKTTITEQILLHGGVLREAGQVKGKEGTKAAKSDWMALEQQRGVSITSSVMQFDFKGLRVNLLDTPGHKDFGEDTYRTLIAADSAAMLIDAAKGVESRTRQLFEVCHMRRMPIFTFANKMDREGKDPLELIDDVENTLGLQCFPVTWPIGLGDWFAGLYHRLEKKVFLYKKGEEDFVTLQVSDWRDEQIRQIARPQVHEKFLQDMDLLEGALAPFDREEFIQGKISPLTFGSAKLNWGVDLFLDIFSEFAPAPSVRQTDRGSISPTVSDFTGFVFKIQANMDRRHRDRVAFVRICSGAFERGMKVKHMRLGKEIRLSYANQFMAQDRETVDEAFAGDIVGLIDPGNFQIGDTIVSGKDVIFSEIPRFSPELFGRLFIKDPLKKKTMQKGVQQLAEEGTIQIFTDSKLGDQDPILGVVGELQFDVLLYRLNDEYGLEVKLERLPLTVARWPMDRDTGKIFSGEVKGTQQNYLDSKGHQVLLLAKEWDLRWLEKENPNLDFQMTAPL